MNGRRLFQLGKRFARRCVASRAGLRPLWGRLTCSRRALPDFLILGAQKSGTTSLHRYLRQHPRVAVPYVKETHFFDTNFRRGLCWYAARFPARDAGSRAGRPGEVRVGEASPYYLFHPTAHLRVRACLADPRFVVLLRNPVDRAYSHYRHSRAIGVEPEESFVRALELEGRRLAGEERRLRRDPRYRSFSHQHHSYVARGLYARQLERWMSCHPAEAFLVLEAERFFESTRRALRRVTEFLGLDPVEMDVSSRHNVRDYPPMDARTRARLEERFAPHNEELSRLLGEDFRWGE